MARRSSKAPSSSKRPRGRNGTRSQRAKRAPRTTTGKFRKQP